MKPDACVPVEGEIVLPQLTERNSDLAVKTRWWVGSYR